MRFLANENYPLASIRRLRLAGYDVASVSEDSPGVEDSEVLVRAVNESRKILTFDRDYGELIYRQRMPSPPGLIYFRYSPLTPEEPAEQLLYIIAEASLSFEGMFTVVERTQIRQRPLP
jgi:predicted nuclease of predicted toxin-antitoxin system